MCLGLGAGCTAQSPDAGEDVAVARAALLSAADCPAGYNIIEGTNAANVINGTPGNDCILAHGGNDIINGVAGDDFLVGGAGDDEIYGADGNDTIYGEDGNDDLNGEAGNDTLHGGIGSDYLSGHGGDDVLNGGDANDQCWGGAGHDVIAGGAGVDNLRGEGGNDAIADSGSNTVNGGPGTDRCTGTSCEQAAPVVSGCTQTSQCAASQTCVVAVGVCLPCGTVGGVGCSTGDNCPSDPNKTEPGICGCGVVDTDSDGDGTANCNDGCPSDAAKVAPGGCGCGVPETDADGDSVIDCIDVCLGFDDAQDADQDGIPDGCDTNCPPGAVVHAGDVNVGIGQSLEAYQGVTCITGSLVIELSDLTSLAGLESLDTVTGDVRIEGNASLASLDGLDNLATIRGTLRIAYNDALQTLVHLSALEALAIDPPSSMPLRIDNNPMLPGCWPSTIAAQTGIACGDFSARCENNTGSGNCGELPPGFVCEPGASGPGVYDGELYVSGPDALDALDELGGITCVTGSVTIFGTDLTDLAPFSWLTAIGGALYLVDNDALESVDGLESLTSAGALYVDGNDALLDLLGLTSLEVIGPVAGPNSIPLIIANNTTMPECWAELIATQVGTTCEPSPGLWNDCSGNGTGGCRLTTSFETIAELDGYDSWLNAVDADGDTVVGVRFVNMAAEGFRYDADSGFVVLDSAHPSASRTVPVDVTADGQTVIGYSSWSALGLNYRAARWNALGEVTHTATSVNAVPTWIAPNGEAALGFVTGAWESPQTYDASMVVTASITAGAPYFRHEPTAASSDGGVVLVNRQSTNWTWESVIYNSPTFGFGSVIAHRAGSSSQYFADMAPDGSVVVGHTIDVNKVAVTWSQPMGYMAIPGLGACVDSDAVAIAQRGGGLRVVGHCDGQAYVWDEGGTARILADALTALGLTPPADRLLHVEDISADGGTLVGYSSYYGELERAWIVRLGADYDELP